MHSKVSNLEIGMIEHIKEALKFCIFIVVFFAFARGIGGLYVWMFV